VTSSIAFYQPKGPKMLIPFRFDKEFGTKGRKHRPTSLPHGSVLLNGPINNCL